MAISNSRAQPISPPSGVHSTSTLDATSKPAPAREARDALQVLDVPLFSDGQRQKEAPRGVSEPALLRASKLGVVAPSLSKSFEALEDHIAVHTHGDPSISLTLGQIDPDEIEGLSEKIHAEHLAADVAGADVVPIGDTQQSGAVRLASKTELAKSRSSLSFTHLGYSTEYQSKHDALEDRFFAVLDALGPGDSLVRMRTASTVERGGSKTEAETYVLLHPETGRFLTSYARKGGPQPPVKWDPTPVPERTGLDPHIRGKRNQKISSTLRAKLDQLSLTIDGFQKSNSKVEVFTGELDIAHAHRPEDLDEDAFGAATEKMLTDIFSMETGQPTSGLKSMETPADNAAWDFANAISHPHLGYAFNDNTEPSDALWARLSAAMKALGPESDLRTSSAWADAPAGDAVNGNQPVPTAVHLVVNAENGKFFGVYARGDGSVPSW